MLSIKQIDRGLVIDHIEKGFGEQILKQLNLNSEFTVALLRNVPSRKSGKKDIIKIDNISIDDVDLNVLGLIDPGVTINVISDGKLAEKIKLTLPDKVIGIFKCNNPRCVTTAEQVETTFYLSDEATREYRCEYCDARVTLRKK
ncbi:MAG TPA: aspartate carbamoyltransferase regulatory subunit [Clostridia bacterium]|nr:aspartate carbamoyltransferase regulatory subunit [Clostridia bacterium]